MNLAYAVSRGMAIYMAVSGVDKPFLFAAHYGYPGQPLWLHKSWDGFWIRLDKGSNP